MQTTSFICSCHSFVCQAEASSSRLAYTLQMHGTDSHLTNEPSLSADDSLSHSPTILACLDASIPVLQPVLFSGRAE